MAEYAHNQWPNATTKKTPYDMIMGYTPRVESVEKPSKNLPQIEERMADLERAREQAFRNVVEAQKVMKMKHGSNKKFRPYKEDDQVWLEGTNLKTLYPTAKLGPKRYGPFKVVKQLSNTIYQLEIPRQWKIHNMFHANLLTPYKEMELHGPNFTQPPPDLIDGEPEYKVEKIIKAQPRG